MRREYIVLGGYSSPFTFRFSATKSVVQVLGLCCLQEVLRAFLHSLSGISMTHPALEVIVCPLCAQLSILGQILRGKTLKLICSHKLVASPLRPLVSLGAAHLRFRCCCASSWARTAWKDAEAHLQSQVGSDSFKTVGFFGRGSFAGFAAVALLWVGLVFGVGLAIVVDPVIHPKTTLWTRSLC